MATLADYRKQNPWMEDYSDAELVQYFADFNKKPIGDVAAMLGIEQNEPGFGTTVKRSLGMMTQGVGQVAEDLGWQNNPVKRYGEDVQFRNPSGINSFEDLAENPWLGVKEAAGMAAGFIGPQIGLNALGRGAQAYGLARTGAAMRGLGAQAAVAGTPSYGQIRQDQIAAGQDNIPLAVGAAGAIGAIENLGGLQRILGIGRPAGATVDLIKEFGKSPLRTAGKTWLRTGVEEGLEELLQNPIEQYAGYKDPTTAANLEETAFGGTMGVLGGLALGPLGAGRRAMQHSAVNRDIEQNLDNPTAELSDRLRAATYQRAFLEKEFGPEVADQWYAGQAWQASQEDTARGFTPILPGETTDLLARTQRPVLGVPPVQALGVEAPVALDQWAGVTDPVTPESHAARLQEILEAFNTPVGSIGDRQVTQWEQFQRDQGIPEDQIQTGMATAAGTKRQPAVAKPATNVPKVGTNVPKTGPVVASDFAKAYVESTPEAKRAMTMSSPAFRELNTAKTQEEALEIIRRRLENANTSANVVAALEETHKKLSGETYAQHKAKAEAAEKTAREAKAAAAKAEKAAQAIGKSSPVKVYTSEELAALNKERQDDTSRQDTPARPEVRPAAGPIQGVQTQEGARDQGARREGQEANRPQSVVSSASQRAQLATELIGSLTGQDREAMEFLMQNPGVARKDMDFAGLARRWGISRQAANTRVFGDRTADGRVKQVGIVDKIANVAARRGLNVEDLVAAYTPRVYESDEARLGMEPGKQSTGVSAQELVDDVEAGTERTMTVVDSPHSKVNEAPTAGMTDEERAIAAKNRDDTRAANQWAKERGVDLTDLEDPPLDTPEVIPAERGEQIDQRIEEREQFAPEYVAAKQQWDEEAAGTQLPTFDELEEHPRGDELQMKIIEDMKAGVPLGRTQRQIGAAYADRANYSMDRASVPNEGRTLSDEEARTSVVGRAIGQLQRFGLGYLVDYVRDFRVGGLREGADAALLDNGDGTYDLVISEDHYNFPSTVGIEAVLHEFGHVADFVHNRSATLRFLPTLSGLYNLWQSGSVWRTYLNYPFSQESLADFKQQVASAPAAVRNQLVDQIVREEAYAQGFAAYATEYGRQLLQRDAPAIARFFEQEIAYAKRQAKLPQTGGVHQTADQARGMGAEGAAAGQQTQHRRTRAEHLAFHGTPHEVHTSKEGRFTLNRIGTGEGAQAYGWGLYFASAKRVAEWYKQQLTQGRKSRERIKWEGDLYTAQVRVTDAEAMVDLWNSEAGRKKALEYFPDTNPAEKVVDALVWNLRKSAVERLTDAKKKLKEVQAKEPKDAAGRLYTVELAPKVEDYLDWDVTLQKMPANVQAAVTSAMDAAGVPTWLKMKEETRGRSKGAYLYTILAKHLGGQKEGYPAGVTGPNYEAASKALLAAGIPGIKYPDGLSRTPSIQVTYIGSELEIPLLTQYLETYNGDWAAAFGKVEERLLKEIANPDLYGGSWSVEHNQKKTLERLRRMKESDYNIVPPQPQSYNFVIFDDKLVTIKSWESRGAKLSEMDQLDVLGRANGAAAADLKLATEAVHAAQKGKWHIVADHMERVAASLGRIDLSAFPSLDSVLQRAVTAAERAQGSQSVDDVQVVADSINELLIAGKRAWRGDVHESRGAKLSSLPEVSEVQARTMTTLGDMWAKVKPTLLTMHQLTEQYGAKLKALASYAHTQDEMEARQQSLKNASHPLIIEWSQLPKATATQLNRLMLDSTLAGIHPDLPTTDKRNAHVTDKQAHAALQSRFNALPSDAKRLYSQVRDQLASNWKARQDAFTKVTTAAYQADIDAARTAGDTKEVAALEKKRDDHIKNFDKQLSSMAGPYFPLMRFGDYLMISESKALQKAKEELKTAKGEERKKLLDTVERFKRDRQHYIVVAKENLHDAEQEKRRQPAHMTARVQLAEKYVRELQAVQAGAVDRVASSLTKRLNLDNTTSGKLHSAITDLYISSLPVHSALKRELRRAGIEGAEENMLRAVGKVLEQDAFHISRLEYAKTLSDKLFQVGEEAKAHGVPEQHVYNDLKDRIGLDFTYSPSPLVNLLLKTSSVYHLGASPAYLLTNLSQPWMITGPVLAARYGVGAATGALRTAWVDAANIIKAGKKGSWFADIDISVVQNADERAMLKYVNDRGQIDITQNVDMGMVAEGMGPAQLKFNRVMGWATHHIEASNRISTALAAYRLARRAGVNHDAATQQAFKAIVDTQLDYTNANAAYWMKRGAIPGVGQMMFQFRKYQQGMVYLLARNAQQSFKGDKEAMRTLAYLMSMQLAFAGAVGLAGAGTVLGAAGMFFDDDDKDGPPEAQIRNWLADQMGPDAARVFWKGLPTLLGLDISKRVGMGDMLSPMPFLTLRERDTGKDALSKTLAAALGAPVGMLGNMWDGMKFFEAGDWVKGTEKFLPKMLADPVKTTRYATDGLSTRSGTTVLKPEKFDAWDLAFRAAGFSPTAESEYYQAASSKEETAQAINVRRNRLLANYANAKLNDKDVAELEEAIANWNAKHPEKGVRIDRSSMLRAVQNRRRDAKDASPETGVRFTRQQGYLRGVDRFAAGA